MSTVTLDNPLSFQHRKVLVLNKLWSPLNIVSLKKAMCLLFSSYGVEKDGYGRIVREAEPKARVLTMDPVEGFKTWDWKDWSALKAETGDETVNGVFRLPRIIVLSRCQRMPTPRVNFNRKTLYRRDNNTCQYCGCKPGAGELTIDHVVPKCQGGGTSWENCVLACIQCNSQKEGRRPEQAFKNRKDWKGPSPMKLLSQPKKPKLPFFKADRAVAHPSWEQFISDVYWSVELQNDM
jgi:hypothetical protein